MPGWVKECGAARRLVFSGKRDMLTIIKLISMGIAMGNEGQNQSKASGEGVTDAEFIARRKWAIDQANASSSIEGHVPTTEYLSDCDSVAAGNLTLEEARARSLSRAIKSQAAADSLAKGE